jgi:CelD/BcsL family acetyltransferase involved in cellulose biosynthesis
VGAPALQPIAGDDPGWLGFIASQPQATVFHHPAWSRVLAEAYGFRPLVLAQSAADGSVEAGLPLLELRRSLRGPRFASLPFTDYCPPLVPSGSPPAGDGRGEGLEHLTAGLLAWQEAASVREVAVHAPLPATAGIEAATRAVRHVLDLDGSAAELEARMKGTQVLRAIKKARRAGLRATLGRSHQDARAFYGLHVLTRHRQGVPVQPRRFMDLLWKHVIDKQLGFIVLVYLERQPVAGALYLSWNRNLIYKFGASDPRYWELRPNNLVMWTAIEWACEQGYRTLDFGRTDLDNQGLRDFKSRWGAAELPLTYSYLGAAAHPSAAVAARRARLRKLALDAAGRVIRTSPPIVCRASGALLYGRLQGFAS